MIYNNNEKPKDSILKNIGKVLLILGAIGSVKGKLPPVSRRGTIGNLSKLMPRKIGQGAEAIVINNSPTTVAKITDIGSGELVKRNKIPNSVPLTFMGYVRDGKNRFPTFL